MISARVDEMTSSMSAPRAAISMTRSRRSRSERDSRAARLPRRGPDPHLGRDQRDDEKHEEAGEVVAPGDAERVIRLREEEVEAQAGRNGGDRPGDSTAEHGGDEDRDDEGERHVVVVEMTAQRQHQDREPQGAEHSDRDPDEVGAVFRLAGHAAQCVHVIHYLSVICGLVLSQHHCVASRARFRFRTSTVFSPRIPSWRFCVCAFTSASTCASREVAHLRNAWCLERGVRGRDRRVETRRRRGDRVNGNDRVRGPAR